MRMGIDAFFEQLEGLADGQSVDVPAAGLFVGRDLTTVLYVIDANLAFDAPTRIVRGGRGGRGNKDSVRLFTRPEVLVLTHAGGAMRLTHTSWTKEGTCATVQTGYEGTSAELVVAPYYASVEELRNCYFARFDD